MDLRVFVSRSTVLLVLFSQTVLTLNNLNSLAMQQVHRKLRSSDHFLSSLASLMLEGSNLEEIIISCKINYIIIEERKKVELVAEQ